VLFRSQYGRIRMEDVMMTQKANDTLTHALRIHTEWGNRLKDWGVTKAFAERRATILNFYGPPGTGKIGRASCRERVKSSGGAGWVTQRGEGSEL